MMRAFLGSALAVFVVTAPGATFDCGPETHSAGVVPQGRSLGTEAVCRNVSGGALDLVDIASGCPCLSVAPATGIVPAGGLLRLRLTLATDGLADRVGFPIEAELRGRPSPIPLFHYEAEVRPAVIAYPEYVDLGDWKRGEGRTVLLVDSSGAGFGIAGASSARGTVDVQWVRVGLLRVADRWTVVSGAGKAAIQGWQVTVRARPGLVQSRRSLSDEVQLDLQHPVQKTVRLRVVGFAP